MIKADSLLVSYLNNKLRVNSKYKYVGVLNRSNICFYVKFIVDTTGNISNCLIDESYYRVELNEQEKKQIEQFTIRNINSLVGWMSGMVLNRTVNCYCSRFIHIDYAKGCP